MKIAANTKYIERCKHITINMLFVIIHLLVEKLEMSIFFINVRKVKRLYA